MKAVILAAGKGTRLAEITGSTVPKPLVDVGGVSVIEHQIALLKRYAFNDIIIVTGHLGEEIERRVGALPGITCVREPELLGTAGGLKAIESLIDGEFVLLYGDVVLDMNLPRMIAFHRANGADCTLAVHPNTHPEDSDLLDIDEDGRVVAFYPKPRTPGRYYRNLVNAAVYVMTPRIFEHIEPDIKTDLGKNIFPGIVEKARLYGYLTAEYIKDIGTPERLAEARRDLERGIVNRMNSEHPRPAVFLDRDGVLNVAKGYISRSDDLELLPGAADAVRRINESGYLAIAVTNQPVVARGMCTLEDVRSMHNKLETELARGGAKLDAIYMCPHHPDRGFPGENAAYKIECKCRKPKPGMLLSAASDFTINLGASYMVGDAPRDVGAARAAGVLPLGVGDAGDLIVALGDAPRFSNLATAVDFILASSLKDA